MKYAVYVTEIRYGCAHVEADNPEEAKKEAVRIYNRRSIDFYEEELSDVSPEVET